MSRLVGRGSTLSRLIFLISSVTVTGLLLASVNGSISTEHFVDGIAFRAAWISLTQIPLVFLLSTKHGLVNMFADISYERINWMHRWIGRFLFATVTIHVVIMKSSVSTRDIFQSSVQSMKVVRCGVGAYGILFWIVVTSILPVRKRDYRAFYINHWTSTIVFLAIVFQHIPNSARPPLYLAISIIALDKGLLFCYFCLNNLSIRPLDRKFAKFNRGPSRNMLVSGYSVEMTAPSTSIVGLSPQTKDSTIVMQIRNIPFSWKPGQHIRLYIPALGALEMHPFTPANCSATPPPPLPPRRDVEQRGSLGLLTKLPSKHSSNMLLMVRAQSGFTRRLADYHEEWLSHPCPNATESSSTLTAYIDGPYGNVPEWERYEHLVLIGTSTGVSFLTSVVDHLEQLCFLDTQQWTTRTITIVWIQRHIDPSFEQMVENMLLRYKTMLRESDITLEADFYTTCPHSKNGSEVTQYDPFAHLRFHSQTRVFKKPQLTIRNPDEIYDEWDREAEMEALVPREIDPFVNSSDWQSFQGDDSSEISTLVEDCIEEEDNENPFLDIYETNGEDTAYRPLPPCRPQQREESRDRIAVVQSGCQCGLIQHQRQKLKLSTSLHDFIVRKHATRPDLRRVISEAAPRTRRDKTAVAVCANEKVTRDVRTTVAQLNIDFALGRRAAKVALITEAFAH